MSQVHHGGCLCSEVRFTATGSPLQAMVCHCTMCQRATGSAFSVELVFSKKRVEIQGPLAFYDHRSADHGRMMHFSFCRTCGTRIGLAPERFPTVQILYAGTFDDPASFAPGSHIFTDSAVPWFVLPEGAQCYKQHMFNADGTAVPPIQGRA